MTVRRRILGVFGASDATPEEAVVAERVGRLATGAGWVVLTGGGPGVMAAASRGAAQAGGLTVGVLPTEAPSGGYPNPWVEVAIATGLGSGRNVVNVLASELCLAIGGGPGTLSEIALALKAGRELWLFRSWRVEAPAGRTAALRAFEEPEPLLDALRERLRRPLPGDTVTS